MRRQPLLTAATNNTPLTMRDKQPKATKRPTMDKQLSLVSAGSENQFDGARINATIPENRSINLVSCQYKSERIDGISKSRAMRLVGHVFSNFKRSSSNKPSTPSALALALEQWPVQTEYWDDQEQPLHKATSVEDQSQTSALTDSDTSAPTGSEDPTVGCCLGPDKGIMNEMSVESLKETKEEIHQSLSAVDAATRIQCVFRGYKQRYEFRFMRLRHKLGKIEALKRRQLETLARRTKSHKKVEKSVAEFHNGKAARQLMRFTRVIPFLFREAQARLAENVLIAHQCPAHTQELAVSELIESHQTIQRIAHMYLESLEDLSGIWEVLKSQWMAPKKPRPRRSFGPDGKPRKVNPKTQFNTHDEDLPVVSNATPRFFRRMDLLPNQTVFEELSVQAYGALQAVTNEDIDRAVDQVNGVVATGLWN